MIRVQALRRPPDLLYQKGYSEVLEDKKWVGAAYDDKCDPPGWAEFEVAYKEAFPKAQPRHGNCHWLLQLKSLVSNDIKTRIIRCIVRACRTPCHGRMSRSRFLVITNIPEIAENSLE
jgi:hypothetical protein